MELRTRLRENVETTDDNLEETGRVVKNPIGENKKPEWEETNKIAQRLAMVEN
jgi:preprotein translocase subunit Sss1